MSDEKSFWTERYGERGARFLARMSALADYMVIRTKRLGPFVFKLNARNWVEYQHLRAVISDNPPFYHQNGWYNPHNLSVPAAQFYFFDKRVTP